MSIIATDILGDLCGLSLGLIVSLLPVGLLLWLLGWWSHRFWIVLGTTVMAGVFGLLEASTWQAQPIVVAVLLAVAAGVMALALVRVITFAVGGLATVYLVQLLFPALHQHVLCFLFGGLICLLLFRWYFMFLTSLLGSSILAYGILALLNYHETIDAVAWAGSNSLLLTVLCTLATAAGFACQFFHDRSLARRRREREEKGGDDLVTMILGRIGMGGKSGRKAA